MNNFLNILNNHNRQNSQLVHIIVKIKHKLQT